MSNSSRPKNIESPRSRPDPGQSGLRTPPTAEWGLGAVVALPKAAPAIFQDRLLAELKRTPEWRRLNKTEKRYLKLVYSYMDTGGQARNYSHDYLRLSTGHCRRTVIRVLQSLARKGLLVSTRTKRKSGWWAENLYSAPSGYWIR